MWARVLWEGSQGKATALQTGQRVKGGIDRYAATSALGGGGPFGVCGSWSVWGVWVCRGADSVKDGGHLLMPFEDTSRS